MPTAWGIVPTLAQLERDLPQSPLDPARRARLAERLGRWALPPDGGSQKVVPASPVGEMAAIPEAAPGRSL